MQFYIFIKIFMNASYKNKKFDIMEPFDGLFTPGMVCHETCKIKIG